MQHSHPTLTFKPLILFPLTSYVLPLHPHLPSCSWMFLYTSCFLFSSLSLLGFFNGILGVFEPGALYLDSLFRLIPLILFVCRNLTLIYLPFSASGFSALRSDRTHFRRLIILSFSELSTSSLSSLDPYSNYFGVNISQNYSSSFSFLNVNAQPIRSFPTDSRTNFFSFSILPSSRNLIILKDFNCHHPLWNSKGTSDRCGEEVFVGSSPLTSSPSGP